MPDMSLSVQTDNQCTLHAWLKLLAHVPNAQVKTMLRISGKTTTHLEE